MPDAAAPGTVAIVLKGYPRLSETFIAQEIHALQQRGLPLRLYSLRRPTEAEVHPIHREITAPVTYLPEYLHDQPLRVLAAWRRARRLRGYAVARRIFLSDLARERSRNRIRRFGQACVLATELPADVARLYAHFLHTPASVARYAAVIAGLPWCASAHAKDIWTTPEWEKREKLAAADWVVTCSAAARDHLAGLAPTAGKVMLAYHGLDFARLPPAPPGRPARDGLAADDPVIVLSVGRAVEKKGYDDLLDALAHLPGGLHWRLVHIGGGERAKALAARASALGLAARITWLGAQPQERVLAEYRRADLFVLASRIAGDGDRDGLPNVLMEAQSQGLPCVATRVSAIPELIDHQLTGLLVPPADPAALAAALEQLIRDPRARDRLGAAGCRRVRADFSLAAGIDTLA
ncbi:MAG TPA: glycosyltransferase family 4 protein, partial [Kiloniellales bacterium]